MTLTPIGFLNLDREYLPYECLKCGFENELSGNTVIYRVEPNMFGDVLQCSRCGEIHAIEDIPKIGGEER
jgi:predicted RNA-binding Zn-ribbon protein involved in translation (DUF1610 family)